MSAPSIRILSPPRLLLHVRTTCVDPLPHSRCLNVVLLSFELVAPPRVRPSSAGIEKLNRGQKLVHTGLVKTVNIDKIGQKLVQNSKSEIWFKTKIDGFF
jgi:hypothetical protein